MDKVEHLVFPELESMFTAIDMSTMPSLLVKKAKSLLFSKAEEMVRKLIHGQVQASFTSLLEELNVPGCKSTIPKMSKKDGVDDFGWLKRKGGFPKWKGGEGAGAGIMDMVKGIIGPKLIEQLEKLTGSARPIIKTYTSAVERALKEWQKGGVIAVDMASILDDDDLEQIGEGVGDLADSVEGPLANAEENTKAAAAALEEKLSIPAAEISAMAKKVPLALMQKAGLKAAIDQLRPIIEGLHESFAKRSEEIIVDVDDRSTDMRRSLDQLLQVRHHQ